MRKQVYVDHIAATAEKKKYTNQVANVHFQHFLDFSACVLYALYLLLGQLCIWQFFLTMIWVLHNATHKLWIMEVLVFLLISPGKSLALHPTVPLNHTLILINNHTLTVAHTQEERTTHAFYTKAAWAWKTKWACKDMVEDSADSQSLTHCYVSI